VSATQREPHRRVIEPGTKPVVGAVALLTRGRELSRDVVRVLRCLIFGGVAGIAVRRHGLKFAVGSALVAAVAVHRSMGTRQREAVVVLLDLLDRNLPSPHRVALLAGRPQLPPVNVRVAVCTLVTDICEDRFGMALSTGDRLMHAA